MKIILTQGIPGSGKTTWAKEYVDKHQGWVRINRDDLRNMRGRYWKPKQENLITTWQRSLILDALMDGQNIVLDDTNLNPKYLKDFKDWIDLLQGGLIRSFQYYEALQKQDEKELDKLHIELEYKFFHVELKEAIKRDLQRPNSVGQEVIKKFWDKYIEPKRDYDKPFIMEQDPKLTHAIIVDLDGTLAIHNNRSPYEFDKCDTDLVNEAVAYIVRQQISSTLSNAPVIIYLSGRDDIAFDKTKQWLIENHLWNEQYANQLYMRKTGDKRKDSIVKREIFEQNIKGKYYVDFVMDDRNQVVEMWREIGLPCFQVNEGDF